jgi:hypothetical protein
MVDVKNLVPMATDIFENMRCFGLVLRVIPLVEV